MFLIIIIFFRVCGRPADAFVIETEFADGCEVEKVTPVKDDLVLEGGHDLQEVGRPEFIPFGGDDQGVGAFEGFVLILRVDDLIPYQLFYVVHGFGVEYGDRGAFAYQGVDHIKGRRFADVVGIGFEGQTPEGEVLAFDVIGKVPFDLGHQVEFLLFVDIHDGVEDAEVIAYFL